MIDILRQRLLILIIFLISSNLWASITSKNIYGNSMSWDATEISSLTYYFNPRGGGELSDEELIAIVEEAISEWNKVSIFTLKLVIIDDSPQTDRNDIYFSSSSEYFSEDSIAAISKVSSSLSGIISEADIIINGNSFPYSNDKTKSNYLGGAIAHEIGHTLGIGHGQVKNSTMFYKLSAGQYQLDEDDFNAYRSKYHTISNGEITNGKEGKISGWVKGSDNVPIFGAQVQAISLSSGKVVAASISDDDGSILLDELDYDDNYFLFVSPTKYVSSLDYYFQSIRADFCSGGADYKGSFFKTCYARETGRPQSISLRDGYDDLEITSISIGCNIDVSNDYLNARSSNSEISLEFSEEKVEYAQVGYFNSNELSSGTAVDKYEIDLSNYELAGSEVYLDIKIISNQLYFPLKLTALIERSGHENESYPEVSEEHLLKFNDDNSINMDVKAHISLSSSNSDQNIIKLTVSAELMSKYLEDNSITDYAMGDIFPDYENFLENGNYYFLMISLSEFNGDEYTTINIPDHPMENIQDNDKCLDGPESYSLNSLSSSTDTDDSNSSNNDNEKSIMSCGTINDIGNGGNGLFSITLGLFLTWFMTFGLRAKLYA